MFKAFVDDTVLRLDDENGPIIGRAQKHRSREAWTWSTCQGRQGRGFAQESRGGALQRAAETLCVTIVNPMALLD